jgi:hypothetical protein
MLARASLCDDAGFAHSLGKQSLTHDVIDFVTAGVVQILTLEKYPKAVAVPKSFGLSND